MISLIHQSKFSIEEDGKDEFKTSKAFLIEMLLDDCSVQNQVSLAEECQFELESLESRTDSVELQDMKNLLMKYITLDRKIADAIETVDKSGK